MTISLSDIIAVFALVLSGYAVWTTSRFNKRQLSLIDSQEKLNKRLLEQREDEVLEARKADVGASIVKLGSSKYRLKVFNRGKAPARSVQIEFPNGNDLVSESEIGQKFPMEVLEQHQSVDMIASVSLGTPAKHTVLLRWVDDQSDSNKKTVYLTL